ASGGRLLVAHSGEQPLALAAVAFLPLLHHDDELCRITALVVAGHARGHGIGRQLVEAVERLALERGCLRLEVTSADHRAPAHAFYRNLGFSEHPRRFIKQLRPADAQAPVLATADVAAPAPAHITGERPAIP
ncbi:MAG TPA: GNAT family N-acetyltransferase, partial [Longimicrobiales bacterium]